MWRVKWRAARCWADPRRVSAAARLLTAFLLVTGCVATVHAQALVEEVATVGYTVSDLERSIRFFSEVLTFDLVSQAETAGAPVEELTGVFGSRVRTARLQLGDETIELTEFLAPAGRAIPPDSRSNDLWFQHFAIVVTDMDAAYQRLRDHDVTHASPGPQRLPDWNVNAGGIEAFYFKDPDGHPLEILEFPPDKGPDRWRRATDRLFLGIDHTALVVQDTERSLQLYRDVLGLRVAGTSENHGPEQERLNNVFGARLRITTLRAEEGPGIELLEYLAPRGGRPAPADLRANDLAHWQTRLVLRPGWTVAQGLPPGPWRPVSGAPVVSADAGFGAQAAWLVRDADGHGLLVVYPAAQVGVHPQARDGEDGR